MHFIISTAHHSNSFSLTFCFCFLILCNTLQYWYISENHNTVYYKLPGSPTFFNWQNFNLWRTHSWENELSRQLSFQRKKPYGQRLFWTRPLLTSSLAKGSFQRTNLSTVSKKLKGKGQYWQMSGTTLYKMPKENFKYSH